MPLDTSIYPVGWVPPVPVSVTLRQAKLALLSVGKLDQVDLAIASLPSPEKERVTIEWNSATTVERKSPTTLLIGAALELSTAELDALFISATKL